MRRWSWMTAAGAIIAAVGCVILVWIQVDAPFASEIPDHEIAYRLQTAIGPIELIGVGLVVVGFAQLLGILDDRFRREAQRRSIDAPPSY